MFGGGGTLGCSDETWVLPSVPEGRPAAVFEVRVAASGADRHEVSAIVVRTRRGGTAYALAVPGMGGETSGLRVSGWDTRTGAWRELGTSGASAGEPSAIEVVVEGADAVRLVRGDGRLFVRFEPVAGFGNGPRPRQRRTSSRPRPSTTLHSCASTRAVVPRFRLSVSAAKYHSVFCGPDGVSHEDYAGVPWGVCRFTAPSPSS